MSAPKRKTAFHFVNAGDATAAPGRKTVGYDARSHAATITHQRRKDKRGATIVKWVNEGPGVRPRGVEVAKRNQRRVVQFEISPLSQLSQATIDPFGTNPHTVLPTQLQYIIDWAYEMVHPKVLSTSSETEGSMIKISWRRIGQDWPVMFDLQVAAAVNLYRADAELGNLTEEMEAMAQKHHARGVKMVRKELAKLKEPPSDALIMAQIMVALLSEPDRSQGPESFVLSPLAKAQNLDRYARLQIVPHLIGALLELVSKRGGLEAMRDFGNSQLLQFADLMISSRLGMPPSFPWLTPSPSILQGPRYYPDQVAFVKSQIIGTGFKPLDLLDVNLADILRSAGEVTVALDHYVEKRPNLPLLNDLVHVANQTHHKLLNVGANMPPYPSAADFLREICRLAGLIYSDIVLFPLPPTTGVRPRLASNLRLAVDRFEQFEGPHTGQNYVAQETDGHHLLLVWSLMVGGLASLHTHDNAYFVQKLREHIQLLPYGRDWRTFSDLMGTYLWWDYIFKEPASMLWMEVVRDLDLHHRLSESGESSHQATSSPTSLPIHSYQRCTTTEPYGLPTPGSSEQSPQPEPVLQWEPIWSLPKDAYLVNWVWC